MSVFIGAEPFTAREKDRFFGRSAEVDEIARKLRNPDVRFLVLFGQSGCGKTSLIRAGVIPALEEDGVVCVYTRPYQHPEQSLKDALEKTVGKRGIIFLDQFEELFTARVDPEERLRFISTIVACITDGDPKQLVFALRSDFFDRLTEIEEYVSDIFESSRRKRIEPFTVQNARTVIDKSLERDSVTWQPALIERVLDDLLIEVRDSISSTRIVLPAELQIVCQMIQRRGWSDVRQYVGKERLIRDYVSEAIETSPNRVQTKRILLELVHENGLTRAQPRTAAEVAYNIGGLTEPLASRHLKHLDQSWRLVNQVVLRDEADRPTGIAYELAHEYLVGVINQISGSVIDHARRANALLLEYRSRLAMNGAVRIPISDAVLIRQHATEEITPTDRRLLRRSVAAFLLRTATIVLVPVMIIFTLRYGTVHFALLADTSRGPLQLAVHRGLPTLAPLLGSDDTLLDVGMSWEELPPEGIDFVRNKVWLWDTHGLSRTMEMLRRWRVAGLRRKEALAKDNADEGRFDPNTSDELAILENSHPSVVLALAKIDSFKSSQSIMALRRLGITSKQITVELHRRLGNVASEDRDLMALMLMQMGFSDTAVSNAAIGLHTFYCSNEGWDYFKGTRLGFEYILGERRSDLVEGALAQSPDLMKETLLRSIGNRPMGDVGCAADSLLRHRLVDGLPSELRKKLNVIEPVTRILAADRLLKMDSTDPHAIDAIAAALETDSNFAIAAAVVQRHRLRDSRIETHLMTSLRDRNLSWAAANALTASGNRGDALISYLEQRLRSDRSVESISAAELLETVEGPTPRLQRRLAELFEGGGQEISQRAMAALIDSRKIPAAVRENVLGLSLGVAKTKGDLERIRAAGYSDSEIEIALIDAARSGAPTPLGIDVLAARGVWPSIREDVRQIVLSRLNHNDELAVAFARVELRHSGESTDTALRRLEAELVSSASARSSMYRLAVERAIGDVGIAEMKQKRIVDPIEFERRLLNMTRTEPFYVRRAMRVAIGFIDETVSLADLPKFADSMEDRQRK